MHRAALAPALSLAATFALVVCSTAQAQGGPDLMKTPECAVARQQLEAVLATGGPRDRLTAVRRQAALMCLGVAIPEDSTGQPALKTERATAGSAPRDRTPAPALAVEPIRLRPSPVLAQSQPAIAPPASPGFTGPVVLANCDATGCWDSAGARYHQQGPVLLGPRGACTQQGGLLSCP